MVFNTNVMVFLSKCYGLWYGMDLYSYGYICIALMVMHIPFCDIRPELNPNVCIVLMVIHGGIYPDERMNDCINDLYTYALN